MPYPNPTSPTQAPSELHDTAARQTDRQRDRERANDKLLQVKCQKFHLTKQLKLINETKNYSQAIVSIGKLFL